MSTILEMQIDELQDELTAIKAINQKLQLEKNALKEQLNIGGVSQQRELLIAYEKFTRIRLYDEIFEDVDEYVDAYISNL